MTLIETRPFSPAVRRAAATRVVCAIDGTAADDAAVSAACDFATPRGHVALVCVVPVHPDDSPNQVAPWRAASALERAMRQARAAGVLASVYLLRSLDPPEAILRAAADGHLLVLGSHGTSLLQGIAQRRVGTSTLHVARVPVLIARPSDERGAGIVVASEGPSSDAAVEYAGRIAAERGVPVTLLTVAHDEDPEMRHALSRQAVELQEATGAEPTVVTVDGDPAREIIHIAEATDAALIVVGSHGRQGLDSILSVSERVAHHAPCSVLVVRPAAA